MDEGLVDGIYDAALEPQRWEGLLQRFAHSFGGAAVYLGQSDITMFGRGDFWTTGLDKGGWNEVDEAEQSSDPGRTPREVLQCPLLEPFDRRLLIPDDVVDKNSVTCAFLTANGLFHATVCLVQADPEAASVFFVARDRQRPIEGGEFGRVTALVPHLGQAMRMHRALRRANGAARNFQSALDRLERGVALVDRDLRITYANPALERMFEDRRGMARALGRLQLSAPGAQRALEAAARRLTDPRGDHRGATVEVPTGASEIGYQLTLAPALGDATTALAPTARIIVFVTDARRALLDLPIEELEAGFALTRAEAGIAALAARALRPAQIADALGVSENTVKSHLKAVYDKLGVRSLAELVRVILTRPR